jgi:hypothetical protein
VQIWKPRKGPEALEQLGCFEVDESEVLAIGLNATDEAPDRPNRSGLGISPRDVQVAL